MCYGCTAAVGQVTLTSRSFTSLTVNWKRAFYGENDTIEWYKITYKESDCSVVNSSSLSESKTTVIVDIFNATLIDNTTLQYNLTGLKKWTGYIVMVSAFFPNGSRLGNTSYVQCQRTLEDGELLETSCSTAH